MILDKTVKQPINNRNRKRFKDLGYNVEEDIIDCYINDLPEGSHTSIKCKCEICGTEQELMYNKYLKNKNNHGFYSCKKCSSNKRKKTNMEKYGTENYTNFEKMKKTKLEKYGDEFYTNLEKTRKTTFERHGFYSIFEDQEKIKKINREIYNVDYPLQNKEHLTKTRSFLEDLNWKEISEKSRKTKKLKYGDENYNNIEKMKKTKLEKYGDEFYTNIEKIKKDTIQKIGVDFNFQSKELREIATKTKIDKTIEKHGILEIDSENYTYKLKCEKGHIFEINISTFKSRKLYGVEVCTICNPIGVSDSNSQKELLEYIKTIYDGEIITSSRSIISPYELDIYLPDLKIAFEYNGIYWHSDVYKDKDYHYNKSNLCDLKGIRLFHIWEDEWKSKPEIIKKIIKKSLNLVDKKESVIIEKINNLDENIHKFITENSIYEYNYGKDNIIVKNGGDILTLLSIDENKNIIYYCENLDFNIKNKKLIKYLKSNYNNIKIIQNRDLPLVVNGFKLDKITKGNFKYILNGKRCEKIKESMTLNKIYSSGNNILSIS